jgi:hypothetical protein
MPCGIHRVFLDTNVVQALEWLGAFIWDGDSSVLESRKFRDGREQSQADFLALRNLFGSPRGVPFEVVVSQRKLTEFQATPQPDRRFALLTYGQDLYDWHVEADDHPQPTDGEVALALGLRQSHLSAFPDELDRELIGEAVMRDCDTFLTLDRKTILRHQGTVRLVKQWTGLAIMRPSEAWELFKPWAALWW